MEILFVSQCISRRICWERLDHPLKTLHILILLSLLVEFLKLMHVLVLLVALIIQCPTKIMYASDVAKRSLYVSQ
ncbi:hypothetical protein Tsubulata_038519 [Turnera subulata]|uniref:Uncharacterized protein n=1 Tax=Turnera subulata TaxID=218843 RepID=A0A9Q0FNW2_9ROSI|nr:hypothetical protein Tsubulata_038519 [Turnera subulata]